MIATGHTLKYGYSSVRFKPHLFVLSETTTQNSSNFFKHLFIDFLFQGGAHATACIERSEDNFRELILFFYHVSSKDQTEVLRLDAASTFTH